jgi:hypothetical protein
LVAASVLPRRSTDLRNLTARQKEDLVRILCSGLLSVLTFGLLLVCLSGLGGCDSRPADGTMVQDSGTASEEEQSKVESHYTDRKKNALKKMQPTRKR